MLNKKICKRCINDRILNSNYDLFEWEYRTEVWDNFDDLRWDHGYVYCGSNGLDEFEEYYNNGPFLYDGVKIDKIPAFCPYYMEHIVLK